jgi:hypothetical protein
MLPKLRAVHVRVRQVSSEHYGLRSAEGRADPSGGEPLRVLLPS